MRHTPIMTLMFAASLVGGLAGAENLLTNPSFDADASAWLQPDNEYLTVSYQQWLGSTLPSGSGPGSIELRLWRKGVGWSGTFQADVPITGGRDYEFAASVLIPSADNSVQYPVMMVEVYDASNQIVASQNVSQTGLPTDSWQRVGGTIAVPSDGVKVRFWMGGYPSADEAETNPGIVYWDDAYLSADASGEAMQSLFVPASAASHGQADTYWSTNGWFSNLTDVTLTIAGAFLSQGRDNSAAVASPMALGTIPPYGFTRLDDLVSLLGESEKTGGIYLELSGIGSDLPAELARVTTHTFTPNPYGDGVYGQGIPAVSAGVRSKAVVPGVFQGSAMRTNVSALNTSGVTILLDVTIFDAAGIEVAATRWTLLPYEQRQVSLPSLGIANLDGGSVEFELSGYGSFRAYTSSVDQASGDAVYNEAR